MTRGQCPTTTPVRVHPSSVTNPHPAEDSPPFLPFLPPNPGGGQGPPSLCSAKPTGGHRGDSGVLPLPPQGSGTRGEEGTEVASLQEGRRDHFGQQQPTYHPHPPVTNQGRRAGKVQLLGFLLLVSWQGQSVPRGSGSVRDTPAATRLVSLSLLSQGKKNKQPFALWKKCLERTRRTPRSPWGGVGAAGSPSVSPGGWEGFSPSLWGGGRSP